MACAQTGSGKTVSSVNHHHHHHHQLMCSFARGWSLSARICAPPPFSRLRFCSPSCSSSWRTVLPPVRSASCRNLKPSLSLQRGSSSTRSTRRPGNLPTGKRSRRCENSPTRCRCLMGVSSRLLQDMCASRSGVWRSQHWLPNQGNPEGLQRAVRNPRKTVGYDRKRKGSVASSVLKCLSKSHGSRG